jgi:hypothetical protein
MNKNSVYQIKISLKKYTPKIWRRLLVPSDTLLCDLHEIIQLAMGWGNEHLHKFMKDGTSYVEEIDPSFDFGREVDYEDTRIADLLVSVKDKMEYEYDFGDSWEHEILLEKILDYDPFVKYPTCKAGKNNCPPEDCGGIYGYQHLVEVINDPKDPEHKDMLEWIGGSFDPEFFDIDEVNRLLNCNSSPASYN